VRYCEFGDSPINRKQNTLHHDSEALKHRSPDDEGIYNDGHAGLRCNKYGLHVEQYWRMSMAPSESHSPVDWRDYANAFRQVLRDSVKQELVSDVPVALNQLLYVDMKMYLEGDILYKVDRVSMLPPSKFESPPLNRNVVNFVTGLPVELKLRRLTGKYLLKKSMRLILPNKIINRPQKGFICGGLLVNRRFA